MELALQRALVVDDSRAIRELLSTELQRLGVQEVLCFDNGATALDYVKAHPGKVDGILTDLHMPHMDGLELLQKLGEINFQGGVIIISAMEERIVQLAVQIALSLHVHLLGSLAKPIDLERLTHLLFRLKQVRGIPVHEVPLIKKRQLLDHLEQGHVLPYYQPKVNIRSKQVTGVEVLCRLDNPEQHEIITPDRFLPVAHRFGLIDLLTEKLMERCLSEMQALQDWPQPDGNPISVAINLMPTQLFNDTLPARCIHLCDRLGFDRSRVLFEITERQVLSEPAQLSTLDRLRIHGFGVSLDDFGTGYTNIRQLRELPFTEIKVDQCLIQHIVSDRVSQVVLESLINIAAELRMTLVTEGIEDIEDYRYLEQAHLVIAQGYLISRPKPIHELERWMHAWHKENGGAQRAAIRS